METSSDSNRIPKNVNKQVKKTVEKYLPGLHNAQMHVNKSEHLNKGKGSKSPGSERYMVTLQKSLENGEQTTHHHFARMTFNKKEN